MEYLIAALLLIVIALQMKTLRSESIHQRLSEIEHREAAIQEELQALHMEIESVDSAVGDAVRSLGALDKRFNRVDPFYREEVDPHHALSDEEIYNLRR